ncbi:TetR/AcrR family transcriptional regulator [Tessaracoccus sp. G1721]
MRSLPDEVKTPRPYDSSGRSRAAADRRIAVAVAARALFIEQGYVATTMDAVAARAGISLKTVYNAFANKSGLLRAVWDLSLKGDLDDSPVAQRGWYQAVLSEPDPRRQLEMTAESSRVIKTRIGPLLKVIRDSAPVDEDLAALWELIQTDYWANQRVIVESIEAHGGLRPGLDVRRATDVLWTLNHPDVWLLLVDRCLWSPEQWEAWFVQACRDQLLPPT